jgi:hypothetical protein
VLPVIMPMTGNTRIAEMKAKPRAARKSAGNVRFAPSRGRRSTNFDFKKLTKNSYLRSSGARFVLRRVSRPSDTDPGTDAQPRPSPSPGMTSPSVSPPKTFSQSNGGSLR